MSTCLECAKVRADEPDYNPFTLILGSPDPGWYSGDDGEFCGPCLVAITRKANGQ